MTSIPETMDSIPEIHEAFNIANQASLSREEVEDLDKKKNSLFMTNRERFLRLFKTA